MRYGSGTFIPQDMGAGIGAVDQISMSDTIAAGYGGAYYSDPEPTTPDAGAPIPQKPTFLMIFLTIFLLLVALKFVSEHENVKDQLTFGGVGVFTFVAVTLMSILGIVATKTVANKFPVFPALTQFVNAV